jgi:hypothetical protein
MFVKMNTIEGVYKSLLTFSVFQSKHIKSIKTSVLHVNGKPNLITLDYEMDVSDMPQKNEADNG